VAYVEEDDESSKNKKLLMKDQVVTKGGRKKQILANGEKCHCVQLRRLQNQFNKTKEEVDEVNHTASGRKNFV